MDTKKVKELLKTLGICPQKSLGQNFLVNDSIVLKIMEKAQQLKPSFYIEIGPGLGALTQFLKPQNTLLIEKDKTFSSYWEQKGFLVLKKDALKVNFTSLEVKPNSLLLSNLPYIISSRLLIKTCLEYESPFESMILMFQKEVAQKITSSKSNKNYGILSVIAQTFWCIESFLELYPKDFYPAPKVASQVLRFKKRPSPFKTLEKNKKFLKFVKQSFSHRRKYLKNNLNLKKAHMDAFEKLRISFQARAQDLSPQDFVDLFCYTQKHDEKKTS